MIDEQLTTPKTIQEDNQQPKITTPFNAMPRIITSAIRMLPYHGTNRKVALLTEHTNLERIVTNLRTEEQKMKSQINKTKKELLALKAELHETQMMLSSTKRKHTAAVHLPCSTPTSMDVSLGRHVTDQSDASSSSSLALCSLSSLSHHSKGLSNTSVRRKLVFDDKDEDDDVEPCDDVFSTDETKSKNSSSIETPRKKRFRTGNSYHLSSPKKWRRMVRSNRLQSILIDGIY